MIQIHFSTAASLMGALLLSTLLSALSNVLQAAPIEYRSVNKSVKDFPEHTDLSSPESALAAWNRANARKDFKTMLDLTWAKLDPHSAAIATRAHAAQSHHNTAKNLTAATVEKLLDTKIVKVLSYREDLAVVIVTSGLNPSERPYTAVPFGRIDGKWKSITFDWRNAKDMTYLSPTIEAAEERFAREKDDLWRYFKQVRDDVKNGRTAFQLSAKQLENIKRLQAQTWAINFVLDMPDLEPQAVQYTIVDKDPALAYAAQVKKMQPINRQQLENADAKQWKDQVRSAQMEVAWNHAGFREVTGDNLWLLTQPGNVTTSSNAPGGKKWVVTKTVRVKEQPVCWSIPIDVKTGQHVTVTFNKDNAFDLRTPYDDVMKSSVDRTDLKEPK